MGRETSAVARMLRYRTTVWGTRADLVVTDPGALTAAIRILRERILDIDRVANRFRADSEVSLLAHRAGHWVEVSPAMLDLIRVALDAAAVTGGAVDPTVGAALCRLGYDRDISLVQPGVAGSLPLPSPVPGWQQVAVDPDRSAVRLPAGTVLDLGATAKAVAADRIAQAAATSLQCGVLISLGGDIAVAGPPPSGGFAVGLGDTCWDQDPSEIVAIEAGGVATSGTAVRHWRLGSAPVHHIVDPATSLPAPIVWRSVSVAAASCVDANVASTAAMVKGAAAPGWLSSLGLPARLVRPDGTVQRLAGWPAPGDDRLEVVDAR